MSTIVDCKIASYVEKLPRLFCDRQVYHKRNSKILLNSCYVVQRIVRNFYKLRALNIDLLVKENKVSGLLPIIVVKLFKKFHFLVFERKVLAVTL